MPQACDGCSSILVVTVGTTDPAEAERDAFDDAGGTLRVACPECAATTDVSSWVGGTVDSEPDVWALASLVGVEARSRKKYSDLLLEALSAGVEPWQTCTLRSESGSGVSFDIAYADGSRSGPHEITEEDSNGPLGLAPRLRQVASERVPAAG